MLRRHAAASSLALSCVLTSCATVVGTLAGPVTGPVHLQDNGLQGTPVWFRPIAWLVAAPIGVFTGFAVGAAADWGCVVSGFGYGAPGHPPFAVVWDPMSPAWGDSPPLRVPLAGQSEVPSAVHPDDAALEAAAGAAR